MCCFGREGQDLPSDAARPACRPIHPMVSQRAWPAARHDQGVGGNARAHVTDPRSPTACRGHPRRSPHRHRPLGRQGAQNAQERHRRDPPILEVGRGRGLCRRVARDAAALSQDPEEGSGSPPASRRYAAPRRGGTHPRPVSARLAARPRDTGGRTRRCHSARS